MQNDASLLGAVNMGKEGVRTTVTIPAEDYEFLSREAEENRVSVSWVVREAVTAYRTKQLLLFEQTKKSTPLPAGSYKIFNVAQVTHRSPFRYPGGKTWLVPYVRVCLESQDRRIAEFIEPFAGGAIVSLSMLFDGLADRIVIAELDPDVSVVWKVILGREAKKLADRIVEFDITRENVLRVLDSSPRRALDKAFVTIVRNRTQRGGIMAPGASLMKSGENGRGIRSRWYPETLAKRIVDIHSRRDQIEFIEGDAFEVIRGKSKSHNTFFYIDPPYTVAGRRLYKFNEVNHDDLFSLMRGVMGDFLMTYDNSAEIRQLGEKNAMSMRLIPMKNTHHAVQSELLLGNDLSWVDRLLVV